MKLIERKIPTFQNDLLFTPIRSASDYAKVLVIASRFLLMEEIPNEIESNVRIKLIIDSMSRLFIYKEDKYFSISFPFITITHHKNVDRIITYSGNELDSRKISIILSILEDEIFKSKQSIIDYAFVCDSNETDVAYILEEILQFEPSYVRYDNDSERINGRIHPQHHLDVNYSGHGTFKLGLNNFITSEYFEDLHNIKTDCTFIE